MNDVNSFEHVLKTFGETAVKVTISTETDYFKELGTRLFLRIVQHCKSVVSLAVDGFNINLTAANGETLSKIQRCMYTVKELSFQRGLLTKCESIFNVCHVLETLSLNYVNLTYGAYIHQHIPNLRNLILMNMPDYIEKSLLSANRNNIQVLILHTSTTEEQNHTWRMALQLPCLTDLYLMLHIGYSSQAYLNNVISEVASCSALKVLKLKLDLFTLPPIAPEFFKTVSSVHALLDICMLSVWSNSLMKFYTIHLRRSDIIHEKYHNFAPY